MRPLDHLVMPTADLGVSRDRLVGLGFSVAPQGNHPFGTINACVYFADGTFIEPLAIGSADSVDAAIADRNSFVRHDRQFRLALGEEGISGLVLGTDDAIDDDAEFHRRSISGGQIVEFSRSAVDAYGRMDTASFRLAFAGTPSAHPLHFFTCERRNAPKIDMQQLQQHENGAAGISSVRIVAVQAEEIAHFLAEIARSRVTSRSGHYDVPLANSALTVRPAKTAVNARIEAVHFRVTDLTRLKDMLSSRGIGYQANSEGAALVPAAPGQGADFIFEELS